MKTLAIALLFALSTSAAFAASKSEHKPVAFDPVVFEEQRGKLVEEITRGERYREIGQENADKVIAALNEMGTLLAPVKSIDELSNADRLKLFNQQELVNNILTKAADDSRVICTRETPVGTHRQVNICKTVAQRRNETRASQDMLRNRKTAPLPRSN